MEALAQFQDTLGYQFQNGALLTLALRHASLDVDEDNEQLEFLGDRVLGLVMAEHLYKNHRAENEGDLSRRLAQLVSRKTCAQVAAALNLVAVLRMDQGMQKRADIPRNILANACEAVLGAVYLDGGLEAVRRVILQHWKPHFEAQIDAPIDSKTALQEFVMQRKQGLPQYKIINQAGPAHAPMFVVEVMAAGDTATGDGSSRKLAEQRAAAARLAQLTQGNA